MTRRRILFVVASVILAAGLLVFLVRVSRISLRTTLHQLSAVSFAAFLPIVLLNFVLIFLSTEKWRSIDTAWRHPSDSVPSRLSAYNLTAIGFALGVFLPTQIAMSTARTLGTWIHGKALRRGTAATLIEQAFDLFTAAYLAVASAAVWLFHAGPLSWILLSLAAILLAMLCVSPLERLLRWSTLSWKRLSSEPHNHLLHALWELGHSPVLSSRLGRRLVFLSALRYVVVVAMSIETARAVGLRIPVWHMGAAIPLVVCSGVIGITPGGIGVNEVVSSGALTLFGTPFPIAAQWALSNRVLIAASYCFAAACSALVLLAAKIATPASRRVGKVPA